MPVTRRSIFNKVCHVASHHVSRNLRTDLERFAHTNQLHSMKITENQEKYYYLANAETIRHGDEYDKLAHTSRGPRTWHKVPDHMIGRQASDPKYTSHTNYRRAL